MSNVMSVEMKYILLKQRVFFSNVAYSLYMYHKIYGDTKLSAILSCRVYILTPLLLDCIICPTCPLTGVHVLRLTP